MTSKYCKKNSPHLIFGGCAIHFLEKILDQIFVRKILLIQKKEPPQSYQNQNSHNFLKSGQILKQAPIKSDEKSIKTFALAAFS